MFHVPGFIDGQFCEAFFSKRLPVSEKIEKIGAHIIRFRQEPTRSLHLPYYSSGSTLSRIFLFLEALPTEVFAGVFIITNHKRAAVTHCLQVIGKQNDLHVIGFHDSKRKLMFFVYRLIPHVSTDFNACKFVAVIVWCGGFIVTEKSLNKPYLAFKHTSLLAFATCF